MPGAHFSKSEIKAKYLERDPEEKLLENVNPTRIDIDDMVNNDNYEVWLIQCPANINLEEQLHNQSIKLPGKTRVNNIETIAEEFTTSKPITLGYKSNDEFSVGTLSATGRILIREKLKIIRNNEDVEEEQNNNTTICHVPLPEPLKQRHPLLGANFEDQLILNEKVAKRLKYCDELFGKKSIVIKQEIKTESDYKEDDMVIEKKAKQKKKRAIVENPENHIQPKKMKKLESGDDESSLAWIKNL